LKQTVSGKEFHTLTTLYVDLSSDEQPWCILS